MLPLFPLFGNFLEELGNKGFSVLIGLLIGTAITWFIAWRKRRRELHNIMHGDARDTVVIALHLVETRDIPATDGGPPRRVPEALRIRSLGQAELCRVVPNGHLESVLMHRAFAVTSHHTLISMEGAKGSYLLETLTNFVCDRTAGSSFEHDLYVMAPCCEPAALAEHQPITIVLISVKDLALFEDWPGCCGVKVEHGSDGTRVLTLREMARRFREEQAELVRLKKAGQRTRYVETMYILDLALDKRSAAVPTQPIPWGRFESVLKELNLEAN